MTERSADALDLGLALGGAGLLALVGLAAFNRRPGLLGAEAEVTRTSTAPTSRTRSSRARIS